MASAYSGSDNNYGEGVRMMRQETNEWHSVMTERPGAKREWTHDTGLIFGIVLAVGVCTLIGIGIANWLTPKVRGGESNGSDPKI